METGAHGRFVGFAAAGTDCDIELCTVGDAFYSDDGINWSAAEAKDNAFTDPQGRTILISAVTPYADGFVATGSMVDRLTETVVGGVWLSKDGATWSAVDMPSIDLGSSHNICEGAGYVVGNLSNLAAVGRHLVAEGFRDGPRYCHSNREYVAFASNDGTTWQPLTLPDLGSNGYVVSLLGGRQFVLLTHGDGQFAVWTSSNGASWNKGSLELPHGGSLYTAVETPDGYLAFVESGAGSTHAQIVLATADGLSWEVVTDEQIPLDWRPISRAVLVGDSIVALGTFGNRPGTPLSGETPISGIVASNDGVTWSVPETEAFSGYYIYQLISNGTSVVASGEGFNDLDEVLFVKSYP